MRQSYQQSQFNLTKGQISIPSSTNIIKVTPFGYQTLSNPHDWVITRNQSKSHGKKSPTKIRLAIPTETADDEDRIKEKKSSTSSMFYIKKRVQSSRKAVRAFQSWTKNQNIINTNIQKQINKRKNEKSKLFEWPKASLQIRQNISGILNKWTNSVSQQKDRANYRLKHIYNRKYYKDRQNDKQNKKKLHKRTNIFCIKNSLQFQ